MRARDPAQISLYDDIEESPPPKRGRGRPRGPNKSSGGSTPKPRKTPQRTNRKLKEGDREVAMPYILLAAIFYRNTDEPQDNQAMNTFIEVFFSKCLPKGTDTWKNCLRSHVTTNVPGWFSSVPAEDNDNRRKNLYTFNRAAERQFLQKLREWERTRGGEEATKRGMTYPETYEHIVNGSYRLPTQEEIDEYRFKKGKRASTPHIPRQQRRRKAPQYRNQETENAVGSIIQQQYGGNHYNPNVHYRYNQGQQEFGGQGDFEMEKAFGSITERQKEYQDRYIEVSPSKAEVRCPQQRTMVPDPYGQTYHQLQRYQEQQPAHNAGIMGSSYYKPPLRHYPELPGSAYRPYQPPAPFPPHRLLSNNTVASFVPARHITSQTVLDARKNFGNVLSQVCPQKTTPRSSLNNKANTQLNAEDYDVQKYERVVDEFENQVDSNELPDDFADGIDTRW